MNKTPKYRRPLNPNQLNTLLFLFKFRFVTSQLLSVAFGNKSRRSTHQTLQILEEQGYIAKRYESSYRLQGRQATYYLLPKAIHEIRARYKFSESALRTYLRNSTVGDTFINHHIDVLKAYIYLKSAYKNRFHIFTKYEITDFDFLPNPKPDIYLKRIRSSKVLANEYLLDIYSNTPLFVIRRRIVSLIKQFESEDWESISYPIVLLCCPDPNTEPRVQAFTATLIDSSELKGFRCYTTTYKALMSGNTSKTIWSNTEKPEHLITL